METVRQNKMGTQPIFKLIISMSLPAMFSMLVQSLYNVVDSVFVAQLGEAALTAVSLAFPVQTLLIAVAVGTGIGINSLVSRRLGEGRREEEIRPPPTDCSLARSAGWYLLFWGSFSPVCSLKI